ncbi:sodium-dependent phosphate transporter 1-like [Oppia nitens]|uniref:sodium-dependent phosphate transporter 1-like n=1 Tax=Oppia nitens TaxID=1686743 RepID=UPI0023DC0645|nr:sodium-dependent phosphate transporter 1-like [Oppia nitens]
MIEMFTVRIQPYMSNIEPYSSSLIWIVVLAFIVAFFLAFGVGANDVANSFGTSVGSKVLTLRQACILATIFEIAGALTLGYKVSSTIRTGMIDIHEYQYEEKLLMLGYLAALIGGAVWNLLATFIGLPISGTHSIVGAIVGFSIVVKNFDSVQWVEIAKIVGSWFISPVLSGIVSVLLFIVLRKFIIEKEKPLEPGLKSLPLIYAFVVLINIFSIIHDDPFFQTVWWKALCIAISCAIIVGLVVWFVVVPRQRKAIITKLETSSPNLIRKNLPKTDANDNLEDKKVVNVTNGDIENKDKKESLVINETNEQKDIENSVKVVDPIDPKDDSNEDKPEISHLFTYLQILTACFGSFAHGGNDVSNAIGPLVAIMMIFAEGSYEQKESTPWYILLYGGIGISIGLWVWGRKVIKTMGNDLTKITPSSGFTIEIGAAATVLVASKIGLPISTTHCKVGSVVMVGRLRSKEGVNWRLFRNIAIAWILTVPLTALCSGAVMALLQLAV